LIRYLIALIAALVLYRMVVRPLRKRYQESKAASRPHLTTAGAEGGEPAVDAATVHARPSKATTYAQGMHHLKDMAKSDPGMVAMIVRNWMSRDES
jgi:flagellar M-ring protein FliF